MRNRHRQHAAPVALTLAPRGVATYGLRVVPFSFSKGPPYYNGATVLPNTTMQPYHSFRVVFRASFRAMFQRGLFTRSGEGTATFGQLFGVVNFSP